MKTAVFISPIAVTLARFEWYSFWVPALVLLSEFSPSTPTTTATSSAISRAETIFTLTLKAPSRLPRAKPDCVVSIGSDPFLDGSVRGNTGCPTKGHLPRTGLFTAGKTRQGYFRQRTAAAEVINAGRGGGRRTSAAPRRPPRTSA